MYPKEEVVVAGIVVEVVVATVVVLISELDDDLILHTSVSFGSLFFFGGRVLEHSWRSLMLLTPSKLMRT